MGGDDLREVDRLGDAVVDGDARERVGASVREVVRLNQKVDRGGDRLAKGAVEIEIDPHQDVVRRILGPGSVDRPVLVQDETEVAGERLLDGGAAHLAVTLHGVRIADVEAGAGVEDRQVERRAGGQVLDVEVAAERAGRA